MLTLGKLTLDAPFLQAGLAGYSDTAMRLIARRHGCPYCVTEAMLDQFLINGGKGLAAAELHPDDHPIAGQLMGSHPDEIAAGAKVLVKLGYDVIDINLACPVKKVKKKSRGGHLLAAADEAIDILKAVADAVGADRPMTVKLRRGSDDSAQAAERFFRILEAAMDLGYAGSIIHGRTVEQKYVGPSNWDFLREVVARYRGGIQQEAHPERRTPAPDFTFGGSGDIWQAGDIFRMIEYTGVDWVSVARGCIGNPWIFRQARAALAGDTDGLTRPPRIAEQRQVLLAHFELSVATHGEKKASMMMRKFGIRFCRHHPEHEAIRQAFIAVKCLADWQDVLERFYADDGPGLSVDDALPQEAAPAECGV